MLHFSLEHWRVRLIAVESVSIRPRTRVQPQLIGCSETETFGSMTFILLLTRRSFGHSVSRRISVWSARMFPVRGFLGFLPATSSIVFIIKNLMVIRFLRRHAVIGGYS